MLKSIVVLIKKSAHFSLAHIYNTQKNFEEGRVKAQQSILATLLLPAIQQYSPNKTWKKLNNVHATNDYFNRNIMKSYYMNNEIEQP